MIVVKCVFDTERDLKEVEPFGFIDLKNAFVERCVPSQVGESDSDYNGIDNPESILGKPSDVFDALRAADELDRLAADANKDNQTDGD